MGFIKEHIGEILIVVGLTIVTLGIYWLVKKLKNS